MEKYSPVEEWVEAPSRFTNLPLNDGEYTVIIDPHTGVGLYLVARLKNTVRYHMYLDGGVKFNGDFKKVTPLEISERKKEQEKFL
jgi:hypothetical protein